MSDLISRQEAMEVIEKMMEIYWDRKVVLAKVWRQIKDLPSAQPEREKGKWIYGEDEYGIDGYRCDKCGFFVLWDYGHNFINYIGNYNFCPSCGADMRGETGC